jgi:streptogramin lyase
MRRLLLGAVASALLAAGAFSTAPAADAAAVPGDITTYSDPAGLVDQPRDVAYDGEVIWFTSYASDRIGKLDPETGAITTYTSAQVDGPRHLVSSSEGTIWFTSELNDRIGKLNSDTGQITTYVDPAGHVDAPNGITVTPATVWFTSTANDRIGKLDMSTGTITTYTNANVDGPTEIYGLSVTGSAWFVSRSNDRIGEITSTGVISTFTHPDLNDPSGLEITGFLNPEVWFANTGDDSIGLASPSAGGFQFFTDPDLDQPTDVTVDPFGRVWFSTVHDEIGRLDQASGSVRVFSTGGEVDGAEGLLVGPTGDVFTADFGNDRIARLAVPTCGGSRPTVYLADGEMPTAGIDVIMGTPGPDVIDGRGGDDVVCGNGGSDTLRGGPGNDWI